MFSNMFTKAYMFVNVFTGVCNNFFADVCNFREYKKVKSLVKILKDFERFDRISIFAI